MTGTRKVANDPQRRSRILDATLEVIADRGVHNASHRVIAARAGVPLGSLTYYFNGIADILAQAFTQLAEQTERVYHDRLKAAPDKELACEVVADFAVDSLFSEPRRFVLLMEMYSYASHNQRVALILRQWFQDARDALAVHFSAEASRAVDALVEGWIIHQNLNPEAISISRPTVLAAVRALVERFDQEGEGAGRRTHTEEVPE